MKKLKFQFREDIIVIDKELNRQSSMKKQALAQNEVLQKQNKDLADIVKAAA